MVSPNKVCTSSVCRYMPVCILFVTYITLPNIFFNKNNLHRGVKIVILIGLKNICQNITD